MTAETDPTTQLKRALQAIKDLRARLENVERTRREPIAVIGMACRLPGEADSPEALWSLLKNRVDGISTVPADRWDAQTLFDADPDVPGRIATKWGGFLPDVDQFDASFFGISPREAASMDPQQRLLLEVTWDAFEDAGLPIEKLEGSLTGVFMGLHSHSNDYYLMQALDPEEMDIYTGTGTSHSVVSGRIAYLFDLHGPNVALDTACSSSLVAVHLAVQSLRTGECNLALAGGVNVMLTPHFSMVTSRMRMMAPDGRCKTFDSRADGFVRSEGCGVVVLKRLSDALADGDSVLAVIRGSAINQDGHTNGLTAPNGLSQQAVIRQALENAGVKPEQISYVEAHGTGTPLGDPIEVEALGAVFGDQRPDGLPCVLGAVKSNLGHLEGAAGVTGLIKTVLVLQHRTIPANLHFQQLNPHISLAGTRLEIAAQERLWETGSERRLAGVSAFGWSGTNAHVILEEAPESPSPQPIEADRGEHTQSPTRPHLLPISARSAKALKPLAQAYAQELIGNNISLADLCRAAAYHRSHHDERLAVVGYTAQELAEQLEAFTRGETRPGLSSGKRFTGRLPGIVFVFPGQGGQWVGMGCQLLEQEPVFRQAIERCEQAFRPFVGWSLLQQLTASEPDSRLEEIDVVQPVLFAIQVALAELWRSWGIQPEAVVGHSLGEIAAAHVAGALSLEEAAHIICTRSQLMRSVSGKGAMAVVGLPLEQADALLANYRDRLSVAVNNSPASIVLSGEPAALEEVLVGLRARNIFCRPVKVDVAAHSPQMEALRPDLVAALQMMHPQATSIPIYSTVTGAPVSGAALDADYWGRNLCQPVRFAEATQRLLADSYFTFIEINPHPILLTAIEQTAQAIGGDYRLALVQSLHRGEDEELAIRSALGSLYTVGYIPKWEQILAPSNGRSIKLPRYPWQRERFWLETSTKLQSVTGMAQTMPDSHPLLHERLDLPDPSGMIWQLILKRREQSSLFEHRLNGTSMLAGSTSVETAMAAAERALPGQPWVINDIAFQRALALSEDEKRPTSIQVTLSPAQESGLAFGLFSRQGKTWQPHVTAKVQLEKKEDRGVPVSLNQIQARLSRSMSGQEFYQGLEKQNLQIGRSLQGIVQLWRGDGEILAKLANVPEERYLIAPALLDAGFQLLGIITEGITDDFCMPVKAAQIRPSDLTAQPVWVHVTLQHPASPDLLVADLQWLDEKGNLVLSVAGLRLKRLAQDRQGSENPADWLCTVQWKPSARGASQSGEIPLGEWLILADSDGVGAALAAMLEMDGAHCILVYIAEPNSTAQRLAHRHFQVQPNQPNQLRKILKQVANKKKLCGIVHLWGLNAPRTEELSVASLVSTQQLICGSALSLVQELAGAEWPQPPLLWLVTRGAQAVDSSSTSSLAVVQASLWGLGRVIAEEQRQFWGGLVDLDPQSQPDQAAQVLHQELTQADGEDQIAYRGVQRHIARLVQVKPQSQRRSFSTWRPAAAYLLTGGLGGVGLHVSRWLASQGVRHLVLMGRTQLPQRAEWANITEPRQTRLITAIRDLEASGVSLHYAAVDVANENQLVAFLDNYRRESWPPIRGVFHAAGVFDNHLLQDLSMESLMAVLKPKLVGAWLLHHYLQDLDFFVLFSSITSLLPESGQGNYAAANSGLDALAHYRQANNQAGISINWGVWQSTGSLADTDAGKRRIQQLTNQGLASFSPAEGLEILGQLIQSELPQVVFTPANWSRYQESRGVAHRLPLLDLISTQPAQPVHAEGTHSPKSSIREQLLAVEVEQRRTLLLSRLMSHLGYVLKMALERIDPLTPLGSYGLDSLMAIEFRNRLEADFGLKLPATLAWNYPTVTELAVYLAGRLEIHLDAALPVELISPGKATQPPQVTEQKASKILASIESLSDEDALKALKKHKPGGGLI